MTIPPWHSSPSLCAEYNQCASVSLSVTLKTVLFEPSHSSIYYPSEGKIDTYSNPTRHWHIPRPNPLTRVPTWRTHQRFGNRVICGVEMKVDCRSLRSSDAGGGEGELIVLADVNVDCA
jgi:hypothetical protein